MDNTHEVISALLDNEPFDPGELSEALSDPAGRALLIDLVMLRQVVQPADPVPAAPTARSRSSWRVTAAAAALVLSIAGGYIAGERRAETMPAEAPAPTRVVEAEPFVPAGAMR